MSQRSSRRSPGQGDRGSRRRFIPPGADYVSPETRLGRKVVIQPNGCWAFNNDLHRYGDITLAGSRGAVRAHRFVFETLIGPIPEGHIIHHECENKGCVNPDHLIALPPSGHGARHSAIRRGERWMA